MDCKEFNKMVWPYLDGELQEDQSALLEDHAAHCAVCTRELAVQKNISRALAEMGQEEIEAPAELCGAVMSQLRTERRGILVKLPAAWRKTVAAAAALLLLASGSLGVNAGLKLIGSGPVIAKNPVHTTEVDSGGKSDGSVTTPDTTTPDGNIIEGEGEAGMEAGETGDIKENDPSSDSATIPPENEPDKNITTEKPAPAETALLSRKVKGTILKAAVDDMGQARAQAVALAAGAGATTQVFPEQDGGKNIVVMRFAAPSEQAAGLINELSGLGNLFDRTDESRDITALYNETLVQYTDLQSRINTARDTGERRQMEAQAASYKAQLEAWDAEAGKQVVTLWLEHK